MQRPLYTLALPSGVLESLHKAGFKTFQDLFNTKKEPHSDALKILDSFKFSWIQLEALIPPPPSFNSAQLLKAEEDCETIPTMSEALDNILGGGFPTGKLIQICGACGSGKTQLAMQLCLAVQIPPSLGSLGSSAVFIDSERGFTKQRLHEMAEALVEHCRQIGDVHGLLSHIQHISVNALMNGVNYIEASTHIDLIAVIYNLDAVLAQLKAKLIVLDSIVMPLLAVTNTLDRTRYLARILNQLRCLAKKHSVSIVVVNDLATWITPGGEKNLVPALGETCSHLSPSILLLAKKDDEFSGMMYKSSSLSQSTAKFKITKEGIRDYSPVK